MKKLLLIIAAISISISFATAQETSEKQHHHHAKHRAEHLTKHLGLTIDQKQKVHELSVSCSKKVAAAKKNNSVPNDLNKEIKLIRTDFKNQMKAILTVDQYNRWIQLKKDGKKKLENQAPDSDGLDD